MTNGNTSAYEKARELFGDFEFFNKDLEGRVNESKESVKKRKPFEWATQDINDDNLRNTIISQAMQNPQLYVDTVSNYLKDIHEKMIQDDLEAIINSAPQEALVKTIPYIHPVQGLSKNYEAIARYNHILTIKRAFREALEKKDEEFLDSLNLPIMRVVGDYLLSDEVTENQKTREFLTKFIHVMTPEFARGIYLELSKKAESYVSNEDNTNEIKGYIKEVLNKDKDQRPRFYHGLFSQVA